MEVYQVDSSGIVKRYVDETGSHWIREICKVVNFYLRQFYSSEVLESLDETKYAYQCLEKIAFQNQYIPSRINRGLLEIAGRILRALKDRRELYSLLLETGEEPQDWYYDLLKKDEIYKKSQFISNLKEQALNYLKNNDSLPEDYLDLVDIPELKSDQRAVQVVCGSDWVCY